MITSYHFFSKLITKAPLQILPLHENDHLPLRLRVANGIEDFLTMGLLPDVKGLYRDDLMKLAERDVIEPNVDAVLLTHAHSDHTDYISFIHEKIPIYMGATCHLILQAIEERANRQIEREILTYKERPYYRKDGPIRRKIITFRTGDKFNIGSLEVEPIHVDHSVPGAYGFIIYTSEGPIAYTGDIRLHGTIPKMTRDFIEKAVNEKLIALIIEGTRIGDEVRVREEFEDLVHKESRKIVSTTNRLVLADFNFSLHFLLLTMQTVFFEMSLISPQTDLSIHIFWFQLEAIEAEPWTVRTLRTVFC